MEAVLRKKTESAKDTEGNWEMANYSSLNQAKSFHLMAFTLSSKI